MVVGTFFPAIHNGFVYDDTAYVLQNRHVLSGLNWQSMKWAFTNLEAGFWHPLTWWSLLLDFRLYGLEAWGYHLTGIVLHGANTVLLFLVFHRMTGATWRSAFVAALFGLHPLHVESVAWIAERKDVLSTFFWMLTLLMYVRYVEQSKTRCPKSRVAYGLALVFFVCGLMSKTMVVTLPLILLLLDWWPLRRYSLSSISLQPSSIRRLLCEKVPFLATALVCGVLTIYAEKGIGALATRTENPLPGRVHNALRSYVCYLYQTFWPADFAVYYPYPPTFPLWATVGAALLLLAVSAAVWWGARRRPYMAAGWVWYVVTLIPVIGLIQVGAFSRADRFTYVPLIGVFLLLTWGAHELSARWRYRIVILPAFAAAAVLGCAVLTRQEISYWRDEETLWSHAVAVTKNNDLAHHNLACALAGQGRFDEAIRGYEEAIRMNPARADTHGGLADALARQQRFAEAIHHYEEVLRLNPGEAEAHNNLGSLLLRGGRAEEAIQHYTEALRLNAANPEPRVNLALALVTRGAFHEAADQLREVVRLNPNDASARQKLDGVLAAQEKLERAAEPYRAALRSNPRDARAHSELGRVLLESDRVEEAVEHCTEATRQEPKSVQAQYRLGVALARNGEGEKAVRQFELALELDPDFAPAHYALGIMCQQQRRVPEALQRWRAAARLAPQWPDPLNNLAWALATDPQADLRDGAEAVKAAIRAAELAGTNQVGVLDTLAAAYAEAGRFAEAIATGRQAEAVAVAQGQADMAEQIRRRLALYGSHQPYREPAGAK